MRIRITRPKHYHFGKTGTIISEWKTIREGRVSRSVSDKYALVDIDGCPEGGIIWSEDDYEIISTEEPFSLA